MLLERATPLPDFSLLEEKASPLCLISRSIERIVCNEIGFKIWQNVQIRLSLNYYSLIFSSKFLPSKIVTNKIVRFATCLELVEPISDWANILLALGVKTLSYTDLYSQFVALAAHNRWVSSVYASPVVERALREGLSCSSST